MEEPKSRYELSLEEPQEAPQTNRCSKCDREKELKAFFPEKRVKSGVSAECRECNKKRHPRKYRNEVDRFWKWYHAHTVKSGECIVWTGYCDRNGNAVIEWEGKGTTVSRVVYRLSIGDVPDNMLVFHSCMNKRCVRHSHLTLGTKSDLQIKLANNAPTGLFNAMHARPEIRRIGEKHHSAKLNSDKVRVARHLHRLGRQIKDIALRFGVSKSAMADAIHGKTWAHVQ